MESALRKKITEKRDVRGRKGFSNLINYSRLRKLLLLPQKTPTLRQSKLGLSTEWTSVHTLAASIRISRADSMLSCSIDGIIFWFHFSVTLNTASPWFASARRSRGGRGPGSGSGCRRRFLSELFPRCCSRRGSLPPQSNREHCRCKGIQRMGKLQREGHQIHWLKKMKK